MKAAVIKVEQVEDPSILTRLIDLPPTVTPNTGYYPESNRGVAMEWTVDDDGAGSVTIVRLSTGHSTGRKEFQASLIRVVKEPRQGPFSVEKFEPFGEFGFLTILRKHVPRYSKKAQAEFDDLALATLRMIADPDDDDEKAVKVRSYFGEGPTTVTTLTVVESAPGQDELSFLQEHVGGYIEGIYAPEGLTAYGNDEAKLGDHYVNEVVTALWEKTLDADGLEHIPGDYIAGPVIFVGPLDDEGETGDITDEGLALLAGLPGLTVGAVV